MARETATITFQLEDEFSAKFQEIVGKLDDFKRRMDETGQHGREQFSSVGKELTTIGERLGSTEVRLRGVSDVLKGAFSEFSKSVGGASVGMTSFLSVLRG